MKPKTLILLIVAVGCGLGASIMTSQLLGQPRDTAEGDATTPVLVSLERVSGWTEIKDPAKQFEIRNFPVNLAPKNAVGELEKIKGKKLNKHLEAGYPLTEKDLLTKEQQSIADQLLPGQRATAIKVNAQSLAGGFVLPGSRVDIIQTGRNNGKAYSRIILQHILVMAVDNQDTRDPSQKTIIGNTVTVAATTNESARLSLAATIGELVLNVKNPGDNERVSDTQVREEDLDRPFVSNPIKGDDLRRDDPAPVPIVKLPAVEPKEEPKQPETTKVESEEPKVKRHVMRIQTGAIVEKAIFMLGARDPDDDTSTESGQTTNQRTKPDTNVKKRN